MQHNTTPYYATTIPWRYSYFALLLLDSNIWLYSYLTLLLLGFSITWLLYFLTLLLLDSPNGSHEFFLSSKPVLPCWTHLGKFLLPLSLPAWCSKRTHDMRLSVTNSLSLILFWIIVFLSSPYSRPCDYILKSNTESNAKSIVHNITNQLIPLCNNTRQMPGHVFCRGL